MGSFGKRMRREREMRGITLESISRTTKIRIHILAALENEEFHKLPEGIVRKGFVRSYARLLGMNEEQVLQEFIEVVGDPEQPLPDPPVRPRAEITEPKERRSWGKISSVVVCAIALLLGGWKVAVVVRRTAGATWSRVNKSGRQPGMIPAESAAMNNASSSSSQRDEQPVGVAATNRPENAVSSIVQPVSQTTKTPAPELASVTSARGTGKLVILVRVNNPAWVSITADGKPFFEGVLTRGKTIRASSEVVLKTNNAGALTVSRNGKPLPSLGEQDQQTTVTFTPGGISHTFAVPTENGRG